MLETINKEEVHLSFDSFRRLNEKGLMLEKSDYAKVSLVDAFISCRVRYLSGKGVYPQTRKSVIRVGVEISPPTNGKIYQMEGETKGIYGIVCTESIGYFRAKLIAHLPLLANILV